ncbi:MAG: aldehyde ferredoxin oxidoreductase [Thermoproteota archaeon]|nr:MAG: aldehyde ferredoxin oxidoreductase [Candidatus Korarchaeota archaeon]
MTSAWRRILYVDLSEKKAELKELDRGWVKEFIGGSGLACRLIYSMVDASMDPLSPASPLAFMAGPLVGTSAPSCGRHVVCGRSPQTGLWGEANAGGAFGARLKKAGVDGVLIVGRAEKLSYLYIRDRECEVKECEELRGATTFEAQDTISRDLGERASVACIGPAGENLVGLAGVANDGGRIAARCGLGALMGSKNLKAIAVSGSLEVKPAKPSEFKRAASEARQQILELLTTSMYRELGTSGYAEMGQEIGDMPAKYFTQGVFEEVSRISGVAMASTILVGRRACYGCPIGCGRVVKLSGRYQTPETDGPEYETVAALGSLLLVSDLEGLAYANYLCNLYGLDTISMGVTIGFAMLLYEKGAVTKEDVGFELKWGDVEAVHRLIEMTAMGEGFGKQLAKGVKGLAARYGMEEYAAHVRGLEIPMHDPRAFLGQAVCYATSPRGACHLQGDVWLVDLGQEFPEVEITSGDRFSDEGKGYVAARCQNLRSVYNSLIMCQFANVSVKLIADMLSHATGWSYSVEELMKAGRRIFDLKRCFNMKLGDTAASDRLPKIVLEPLKEGGTQGHVPDLSRQLKELYEARGWDPETGKPLKETLVELGLEDAARDLWGS